MRKLLALAVLATLALPAASALAAGPGGDPNVTAANAGGSGAYTRSAPLFGDRGLGILGACIGAGLVIIGAARGIGAIGSHAVDAIARQPEAGGRIFTSMIIAAALVEGATLFAIVVCLIRNVTPT